MPFNFFFPKKQKVLQADGPPRVVVIERDQQRHYADSMEQGQHELLTGGKILAPLQNLTIGSATTSNALVVQPHGTTTSLVPTPHASCQIMGDDQMNVTFTNPTSSDCAVVQVPSTKTASECLQALKKNGFLGQGNYHLIVNGKTMSPDQTLGETGLAEGGTIVTQKIEAGA